MERGGYSLEDWSVVRATYGHPPPIGDSSYSPSFSTPINLLMEREYHHVGEQATNSLCLGGWE